jgi:hypothetical protein
VGWGVHARPSGTDAVAEADVAGTAAAGGVLPVGRDTFNPFTGYVPCRVDFGVMADVAGAWEGSVEGM